MYVIFGKRLFDFLLAAVGLVLLAPVLLTVAVLVRWKLGSPVIFKQQRPGLHGKLLTMYKYRTMTNEVDENKNLLPSARRLVPFGRFLRRSSLDEIPQLLNVVRGDLSLVGPRPLLTEYLSLYSAEQARRHEVRPGITGWAQVNGRSLLTWEERFKLDVWYVDHVSFLLDLRILGLTLWRVLRPRDSTPSEGEIAPRFRGSEQDSRCQRS